jgi:hypothetical protein
VVALLLLANKEIKRPELALAIYARCCHRAALCACEPFQRFDSFAFALDRALLLAAFLSVPRFRYMGIVRLS